jgi:hypothetical protein
MELGSYRISLATLRYFLFLQEQIKDIIIIGMGGGVVSLI